MSSPGLLPEIAALRPAWDRLKRPVWVFDQKVLRTLYANPPALSLWGAATLDDLLARDFSDQSEAARLRGERLLKLTADGGEVVERWTFYPKRVPVTVDTVISSLPLAAGHCAMLLEGQTVEFLSDERRAVEALRHTTAAISLFDTEGRALFSNPAAWQVYGDKAVLADRFVDPAQYEALVSEVAAGRVWSQVCALDIGSELRWRMVDARPAADPATGVFGTLVNEIDVTVRIAAEVARAAAEAEAALAGERQQFLSEMSHELRTPLNAVLGFSELLMASPAAGESRDHAARIRACALDMSGVVERLIDLAARDDWNARQVERFGGGEAPRIASGLRILCVDDNENNRALLTTILSAQGMECGSAGDGAAALAAAENGGWNIILMDVNMPQMDGIEATRRIRSLSGDRGAVPIIAVTANTLAAQRRVYVEAGMNDVISKPVNVAALLDRISAWTTRAPLTLPKAVHG